MRRAVVVAFVLALLAVDGARAQPCNPAEGGEYCDADGVTLHYCEPDGSGGGTMMAFDCSAAGACGPRWECASGSSACFVQEGCIGVTDGDYCAVAVPPDANPYYYWGCGGGLSCTFGAVVGGFGESCFAVTPTVTCADGELHKGCVGDVATRCDSFGPGFTLAQVFGTRCAHFEATCVISEDDLMPVCESDVGEACMNAAHLYGDTLRCAAGLVCVGSDYLTLGTCVDPSADGGVPDGGSSLADGGLLDAASAADAGATPVDSGVVGGVDAGFVSDGGAATSDAASGTGDVDSVFEDRCDGLGARGTCDGDVLRWCQAGRIAERDCAEEDLVCAEVGLASGFDCLSADDANANDDGDGFSLYCRCVTTTGEAPFGAALLLAFAFVLRRRQRACRQVARTSRPACGA